MPQAWPIDDSALKRNVYASADRWDWVKIMWSAVHLPPHRLDKWSQVGIEHPTSSPRVSLLLTTVKTHGALESLRINQPHGFDGYVRWSKNHWWISLLMSYAVSAVWLRAGICGAISFCNHIRSMYKGYESSREWAGDTKHRNKTKRLLRNDAHSYGAKLAKYPEK